MNKKHNIFVIVVTYKGQRWYDKCFSSLRESVIPVQTVVVDNSPTEADSVYIRAHYPEVTIIRTNENLGFGKANNLGLRYALDNGCDYVFLLNQDAWIEPNTIEVLVDVAQKHHEYGIISPIHENGDHTELNISFGTVLNRSIYMMLSDLYTGKVKDIYETKYVNAAAWLLPRRTLETVGGFDPIFFHYSEDDNYMHRVIYHGLKMGVCPLVYITHDHQKSELSDSRLAYRQKQYLISEWTDINVPYTLMRYIRFYLRKWILYVCTNQWGTAKRYRKNIVYCIKMNKAVLHSRNENLQKKASWL